MPRCFVFAAGDFVSPRLLPRPGDLVIAADAGYLACRKAGVRPDIVLGDFDSMDPPSRDAEIAPVEKDDTDEMLALRRGLALGFGEFHIYGGTGGQRLDHTLANMQSLLYLRRRGARGFLHEPRFLWTAIENETWEVERTVEWGLLSLFPMDGTAEGVTLTGLQYPLENAALTAAFPLGVSNHLVAPRARVRVERGALLVGWEVSGAYFV